MAGEVKLSFGQVTFNPLGDGTYSASVMIQVQSSLPVQTPWFQVTINHVHTPQEAQDQARGLMKEYVATLAASADKF